MTCSSWTVEPGQTCKSPFQRHHSASENISLENSNVLSFTKTKQNKQAPFGKYRFIVPSSFMKLTKSLLPG